MTDITTINQTEKSSRKYCECIYFGRRTGALLRSFLFQPATCKMTRNSRNHERKLLVIPALLPRGRRTFQIVVYLLCATICVYFVFFKENKVDIWISKEGVRHKCRSSEEESFNSVRYLDPLDEAVLKHLQCFHLFPPSGLPLNVDNPAVKESEFQIAVQKIYKGKKHGFFIECGANDGEFYSNTLPLEMNYNWTGLLIEAHPHYGKILKSKNRNAWFADVCLSPNRSIIEMEFLESIDHDKDWKQGIGKLNMPDDVDTVFERNTHRYNFKSYGMVRCFPLVSILAALEVKIVDYFSLDVQGIELKILKTLPYDDTLTIKILQTESSLDPEGKEPMRKWMLNHGYKTVFESGEDFIFVLNGQGD